MGSTAAGELAELLSRAVLEYRKRGSVDEDLLKRISEAISGHERDSILREHLQLVIKSLREGDFEERSLLGKSVRMDRDELLMIIRSIDRFLGEEPFKEMETRDILQLWKESLEKVLMGLEEIDEEISS